MKTLIALILAVAFVAGLSGASLAQGTTGGMKEQPATSKEEPKKPAAEKKPTALNANGTVKSAAGDSIVVTGKTKGKDTEWTFAVDPKTKVRKAGKDISPADLAAGDNVHVRYHEEGGKKIAETVMVRAAKKTAESAKPEPTKTEKK